MIDRNTLTSPETLPPEGMCVAMAVEHEGKDYFIRALRRNNQWVLYPSEEPLSLKLVGWTGMDKSWGHRNK